MPAPSAELSSDENDFLYSMLPHPAVPHPAVLPAAYGLAAVSGTAAGGGARGPDQRGYGRDVQGEQQRHVDGRDQRERQPADRRTGRGGVDQLESDEGAE